ncbi:MAG: hypothetical protein MJ160_02100 [Treponema sp.]|nr:hypothetical protein [Treponema sp.]
MKFKIFLLTMFIFSILSCSKNQNRILQQADEIISALENKRYNELINYINKDEGLYVAQRISTPVKYYNHLSYDDLKTVMENNKEYSFYIDDDPSERWNTTVYKFLNSSYPIDQTRTRKSSYNEHISIIDWGITVQSISEIFQDCIFVEYYYEPSGLYGAIDWTSVYLIFNETKNGINLIGLACNYAGI